jgi:hypothetical protein
MEENRKKHFNVGEVKTRILEYILRHEIPVKELELTEYLKEKYSEFNRASVNRHLSDLEKLKCVTKVTPVKKSRFNYWDIEFKNLKNIEKEFLSIPLMEYTKSKDIIIKTNFPGIGPRYKKKYFVYMSLFPSLFNIFINNEFEPLLKRASELWRINDYKDIIDSKTDFVYEKSFLRHSLLNPLDVKQIIEISKDELQKALAEIQYPYEEQDWEIKQKIVEKKFLENLIKVILPKRPNGTEEQVRKEILNEIIDRLFYKSGDRVFEIVYYLDARRQKMYDRICKHFYENDFLVGKATKDAKKFVDDLEKCINKVNSEDIQAGIVELDVLYDEWYEKCISKSPNH